MWEFTLAKSAAWHSYLFADLRRLCRTKDGITTLQCLKTVTCAALVLAKKILTVKRGGYLQRRRGHGRKPWLGVIRAICISASGMCMSSPSATCANPRHICLNWARRPVSQLAVPCCGPCLCQFLLAAYCACNCDLTFVSHGKCRYH